MQLALLPLSTFLLPSGITRLKVWEPKYLRLVHESVGETGFVIATSLVTFEATEEIANWGSWVKIIDFAMGDDNLLTIDVQCQSMVNITSFDIETDGLMRGDVSPYEHWNSPVHVPKNRDDLTLQYALIQVFNQKQDLSNLYPNPEFDSLVWACQRWVEILPLKPAQQNQFAKPDSFHSACTFIQNTILG